MDKLMPCPFCGGPAQVMRDPNTKAATGICCRRCKVVARWERYRIADAGTYGDHEQRIRQAWNRRAKE